MAQKNKKHILILGAGFGGVYTYKFLHQIFHDDKSISISLVNKRNYFLFTPLLHEVAGGMQSRENIVEPLRKELCCIEHLYIGDVKKIDPKKQTVHTTCADLIRYDYLVVALGSTTNFFNAPGAEAHSLPLKTTEDAVRLKNTIIGNIEASLYAPKAEQKKLLHTVVVGGGATGVELVAELAELIYDSLVPYYKHTDIETLCTLTLVHAEPELIPQFAPKVRRTALRSLLRLGVEVLLNTKVVSVGKNAIELDSGKKIDTACVVWTAGITPQTAHWQKNVSRTREGHILVNEFLQTMEYANIYALGDNASFTNTGHARPVPALAQTAVSQAEQVAQNIARDMHNQKPKKYRFREKGQLISLGTWHAGGTILGISFAGRFAWWLWRTVYLFKMLSWQKKVHVAVDWTLNIFSKRDISEL